MQNLRRIKTHHTQWIIDQDLKRFIRIPLDECPDHPSLKYFGSWESYDKIEESICDEGVIFTVTRSSDGHRLVSYYQPELQV